MVTIRQRYIGERPVTSEQLLGTPIHSERVFEILESVKRRVEALPAEG